MHLTEKITHSLTRFIGVGMLAGAVIFAPPAFANSPPQAAIASAHPLATQAGHQILAQGGNAFDAAISVAAVLAVVEPAGSGMGGGGFWLLHDTHQNRHVFVDARETAPLKAHQDMYLDEAGNVVRDLAINTPLAAGIPGQAAAFVHLAEHYGKLPLSASLAPAIKLAEEGFPVSRRYQRLIEWRVPVINRYPAAASIFLQDGQVPPIGHLIKQPDLANTLRLLADQGKKGFYEGKLAEQMVSAVQKEGGIWQLEDLANYQVVEREPIVGEYQGATIITSPPPSSGGIALLQAFGILSHFGKHMTNLELAPHLVVEAWRRAYYDRGLYLGDSDFVDVPTERLLSKKYIRQQAKSIDINKATNSESLGPKTLVKQGQHTTHYSILDTEGNKVAATLSVNLPFGSGYVVPGTGLLLNNEMDDFSAKPGEPNAYGLIGSQANAIEPGKRPLSSMTPTFVEWNDQVAILGTPGGSRIITMVFLGIQQALAGKPIAHWVSRPRYHHQYLPDVVEAEPAFMGSREAKALEAKGHKLQITGRQFGDMQAVHWDKNAKKVEAASDPRGEGLAE